MIVGIHQPNYLPHLGFFDKIKKSDIFVIYDDAQFSKEYFVHRNKIRIYHGWKYLTVPVEKKRVAIKEVLIKNEVTEKKLKWSSAHIKEIRNNYKDTLYYDIYKDDFEMIYNKSYERLIDLNMEIINFFINAFSIKTKLVFSSEFGFTSKSTDKLVDLVGALGGDVYISGSSGLKYLDSSQFEKKGINLDFQNFEHPIYKQCFNGFVPNMASIDALFNTGIFPSKS